MKETKEIKTSDNENNSFRVVITEIETGKVIRDMEVKGIVGATIDKDGKACNLMSVHGIDNLVRLGIVNEKTTQMVKEDAIEFILRKKLDEALKWEKDKSKEESKND